MARFSSAIHQFGSDQSRVVVLPADEIEARQDLGIGEGEIAREDDEAVDEDKDCREAGRQHDAGQEFAEPLPGRPCRLGDRSAAL